MNPILANENKITKGYNTMDAMGCMLLRECTDGVDKVESIATITDQYPDSDFGFVADEFNTMLVALEQVGVGVFLADAKYFPVGHRGVYHTVSNNFFLNRSFMHRPHVLMSVMRHEGWHAAQDCMAGTIKTLEALQSCARGTMWSDYEPTPMTREWLVENGFLEK